jgi:hypothetical protein
MTCLCIVAIVEQFLRASRRVQFIMAKNHFDKLKRAILKKSQPKLQASHLQ